MNNEPPLALSDDASTFSRVEISSVRPPFGVDRFGFAGIALTVR